MDDPMRRRLLHHTALRHPGDPSPRRLVVHRMSSQAPPELPGVDAYKHWNAEAQERAFERLKEARLAAWKPFYCRRPNCDGHPHGPVTPTDHPWEWEHARADQRPPRWTDKWLTFLLRGGRGSGKTRTGAEVTHGVTKRVARIGLVAPTGPDFRDTIVEGESGILACSPPGKRPLWEPSKKKLTWPNGAIAQGFSAEEPDRLRGPQFGFVWGDEPAHWPLVDACWDNILFSNRIKSATPVRIVMTSTPKPIPWLKNLIADPRTVDRRVSTYANLHNLTEEWAETVLSRYEGTRTGKQELHGEILEDVEGALWKWEMFQWVKQAPDLVRIVVGVDPAGTANKRSDETGIVVVGIGADKNLYVLSDDTGKYSPAVWGRKVNSAYDDFSADALVPEKNYGADMVTFVLENSGYKGARIKPVQSRRGKELRAEPIVALYEKHRVFHVGERGDLAALEEELTTWVPGVGQSPNRVDALVHAATDLAGGMMPAEIATPTQIKRRTTVPRHLRSVG